MSGNKHRILRYSIDNQSNIIMSINITLVPRPVNGVQISEVYFLLH